MPKPRSAIASKRNFRKRRWSSHTTSARRGRKSGTELAAELDSTSPRRGVGAVGGAAASRHERLHGPNASEVRPRGGTGSCSGCPSDVRARIQSTGALAAYGRAVHDDDHVDVDSSRDGADGRAEAAALERDPTTLVTASSNGA